MILSSTDFDNGEQIPELLAFCKPDSNSHAGLSSNRNPHLKWADVPSGVKSFALLCCDPDVPSRPDDVNQAGKTVPADLPRIDFYHWVLADIPASESEIASGSHSNEVTPCGKSADAVPSGMRHGVNDYTLWFAGDEAMGGEYFGYDGPCTPWNDSIIHHYHFTIYALDVQCLSVSGSFTGQEVVEAMQGHILDQASLVGTYTLNPALS
ncbi:MAG: YbhB/YbcL family Raf kinase inhibitor-like protein [Acidiferrobacterales bacterium]|nr:YbhB/YbcL family Raf kinase inhibitor-like protein [Acidiferrobacterales bacterium]